MHVIRLRRPWEKSRNEGSQWTRIDVPEIGNPDADDHGHDDRAVVLYRRGFHLPSGLQPSSRVRLCIDRWLGHLESITVNGSALESDGDRVDTDITELLRTRNQIVVRLSGAANQPARMSGEVTLAIEDAAGDDVG